MRVGVMGGTFDPIHLGHLRAAESARESLALDQLLFVPAGQPPHKNGPRSSALDRYTMVALATAGHPAFVPSDLELFREGPSYTVDTLTALRDSREQDQLVLIVGSDTYPDMDTWRDHARLRALAQIAVVVRPGGPELPSGDGVELVHEPGLPISATHVRERVRAGRSVRYLVPEAVADYIAHRRLYS